MLCSRKYDYESGKQKRLFEKTDITDVYNLFDGTTKVGIAHVPNMKISLYLQDNVTNRTEINCVFNKNLKNIFH